MRPIFGCVALVALAGCATGNCDPNTAGFLSGISNEVSGCYAAKDQELRGRAFAAGQNAQIAEQQRALSVADEQRQQQALSDARKRLNRISGALQPLRARLDNASHQQNLDQAKGEQLRQELSKLQHDLADAQSRGADPAEIAALERRRQKLNDEMNDYY